MNRERTIGDSRTVMDTLFSRRSDQPTLIERGSNVLTNVGSSVRSGVGTAVETISAGKDKLVQQTATYGYTIFVAVFIAIILFIIAYLLYIYLRQRITKKIVYSVPAPSRPMKTNEVNRLSGDGLPPSVNGSRQTFMFWMYIHDINLLSGSELRHVIHIGDETSKGSSPSVFLDGMKNRLYVRFSKKTDRINAVEGVGPTNLSDQIKRIRSYDPTLQESSPNFDRELNSILGSTTVTNNLDAARVDLATHGVVIDYIPLQRWVHVAIVVNETVNRGYINTYLDGEIVSSIGSSDTVVLSNGKMLTVDYTGIDLDKRGDVYVGGDIYSTGIPRGFSGLVSRVVVANYDMNAVEVKKVFYKGPIDMLASDILIPGYGIRSPIYKID